VGVPRRDGTVGVSRYVLLGFHRQPQLDEGGGIGLDALVEQAAEGLRRDQQALFGRDEGIGRALAHLLLGLRRRHPGAGGAQGWGNERPGDKPLSLELILFRTGQHVRPPAVAVDMQKNRCEKAKADTARKQVEAAENRASSTIFFTRGGTMPPPY